jgi:hypothetical protein
MSTTRFFKWMDACDGVHANREVIVVDGGRGEVSLMPKTRTECAGSVELRRGVLKAATLKQPVRS